MSQKRHSFNMQSDLSRQTTPCIEAIPSITRGATVAVGYSTRIISLGNRPKALRETDGPGDDEGELQD